METLLAGFLPRYRRRHPGVEVHLVEDGGVRLATRLERGDVNLALTAAGDARFSARLLAPLYVLAVRLKSRGHGWGAALEIESLASEPLLLLRRDFASREWFDAACQVAHLRPRVLLESGAPHTLVALAQAGVRCRDPAVQRPDPARADSASSPSSSGGRRSAGG